MAFDWLKRKRRPDPAPAPAVPEVRWLGADENPWGVPVLDVRPVTLGMISSSQDPRCATNAVSYGQDDGLGFVGVEPRTDRRVAVDLRFRIDRLLADGVLFIPDAMEQKWALFFHRREIICVRSWLREVVAVGETRPAGDAVEITALRGFIASEDEDAGFSARALDYLLRSHALDEVYPAPLPPGEEADPSRAAI